MEKIFDTFEDLLVIALLALVTIIFAPQFCHAQNYQRQGNAFTKVTKKTIAKDTLITHYTYIGFPVIVNKATGSCYYYVTTSKGERKRYVPKEVADVIRKELGITKKK